MDKRIWKAGWNDTDLRGTKKIYSGLVIGMLTTAFSWFAGLRTWQQALLFVVCSVAAYLLAVLVEFLYRSIGYWKIQRKQILISTYKELTGHFSKIEASWSGAQRDFDIFKDVYKEVERCWQEWEENKTDPQRQKFLRDFPGEGITLEEINHIHHQLIGAAANIRESCKNIEKLYNFDLVLS